MDRRVFHKPIHVLLILATTGAAGYAQDEVPTTTLSKQTIAQHKRSDVTTNWITDEEFDFDWRGDGTSYQIKVQRLNVTSQESETLDEDNFTRLLIKTPNGQSFYVKQTGGVVAFSELSAYQTPLQANEISSRYLYARSMIPNKNGSRVVFMFGWAFASSPGAVTALALNESGAPTIIFSPESLDIHAVTDTNNDGVLEIIGRVASESLGECKATYSPYEVYTVSLNPTPRAQYSLRLSKQYNLANYYGWIDSPSSDSYYVITCPESKIGVFK